MLPDSVGRLTGRLLSTFLDPTIVFSFDRTGFALHASQFEAGDLDVDMRGRVCLITGANSGIGFATTRALAHRGADVWLLCRNEDRARAAAEQVRRESSGGRVRLARLDLASLGSIREFVERFGESKVDVLVNNAGVLPDRLVETEDGLELTLATNLVGPFLLTELLMPRLKAAGGARVINVSSGGMYTQRLDVDALRDPGSPFDGVAQYARTKRAEVVLSELWAERTPPSEVVFNAMHPGWADTPAVQTSLPGFHRITQRILRTPEQGADTVIWLAVCRRIARETGQFWFDRQPRWTHYLPWTRECDADRHRLWEVCCDLAGLPDRKD